MEEIGDRLTELRADRGYTQRSVSAIIGIAESTIVSWEHGLHMPSAVLLAKLCKLYKVSADYIIFGKDNYYGNGKIQDRSSQRKQDGKG